MHCQLKSSFYVIVRMPCLRLRRNQKNKVVDPLVSTISEDNTDQIVGKVEKVGNSDHDHKIAGAKVKLVPIDN